MNDQPQNDQPQNETAPAPESPSASDPAPVSYEARDRDVLLAGEHAASSGGSDGGGLLGWMRGRGRWIAAGGLAVLLATGIGAGAYALGGNTGDATSQVSDFDGRDGRGDGHGDRDGGNGEELLTGTDLTEVTAAVEAEYPGSTMLEAETDSDGVFEAHIVTNDGDEVTVEIDETYAITGTEDDQ